MLKANGVECGGIVLQYRLLTTFRI